MFNEKSLEDECPICFEINGTNECILLDCCDRYIHKECLHIWLNTCTTNKKCLYCMKESKYFYEFKKNNNNHQIVIINNNTSNNNNNTFNVYDSYKYVCLIFCVILFILIVTGSILLATIN